MYNELLLEKQRQDEEESDSEKSPAEDEGMEDMDTSSGVPSLFSLFSPLQFVRCVVVEVVKGKDVEVKLSMRPTLLNAGDCSKLQISPSSPSYFFNTSEFQCLLIPGIQWENLLTSSPGRLSAAVKSIEDHGYVMSLGDQHSPPAFLPFSSEKESGKYHQIGQVLEVSVTEKKGKSSSVVLLSADPKVITHEKMV